MSRLVPDPLHLLWSSLRVLVIVGGLAVVIRHQYGTAFGWSELFTLLEAAGIVIAVEVLLPWIGVAEEPDPIDVVVQNILAMPPDMQTSELRRIMDLHPGLYMLIAARLTELRKRAAG